MIKVEYFGEKSLESSKKSVSKGGAVAPTSSAVDPPLIHTETNIDFDPSIDSHEINAKSSIKTSNKKRKKRTTTNEIISTINLAQVKAYFTKGKKQGFTIHYLNFAFVCFLVLSFTKYINEFCNKNQSKSHF